MAHGDFVWCDLSAHDADPSRGFYRDLFGWTFVLEDDTEYDTALNGNDPVGGHFQMPQKFMNIGMPAFWMSYIDVDDVTQTAELAQSLGGKVEIGPSPFMQGAEFALIRDPLGAGFTVCSGTPAGRMSNKPGNRVGHSLFVSDRSKIQGFYENLFGWTFSTNQPDGASVVSTGPKFHCFCHEIPDESVRGKEEFWAVFFAHADLGKAAKAIGDLGGKTAGAALRLNEGKVLFAQDRDGATFGLLETQSHWSNLALPSFPLLAWFGLALVILGTVTDALWIWLVFLGVWVTTGLASGETHLFETVERRTNPFTYWAIMATYGAIIGVIGAVYAGVL